MSINYSQSKVKGFRRCQKQFAFRHDYAPEGKELVKRVSKRPLKLGSWMHSLQEAHHMAWAASSQNEFDYETWQDTHDRLTADYNKLFIEEREDLGDLPTDALRLWKAYLRFYGDTEDRYKVATLKDGSPAVEFVVEQPLPGIYSAIFKGRVDLMVEDLDMGGLWIWDAKWVKKIPGDDERMMSPQSLMYPWALRKMGYDVRGFVYNYGRTKAPTIPKILKKPAGQLSMAQKMDTDYYTYLTEIKAAHGAQWKVYAKTVYRDKLLDLRGREKLWFRREPIPIDKGRMTQSLREFVTTVRQIEERSKPDRAPRTYLYSCNFPNAGCEYHDMCVAEFHGLNIQPIIKAQFEYVGERYGEEEDLLSG